MVDGNVKTLHYMLMADEKHEQVHTLMDFHALSWQIRVIPAESDSVAEVKIHRFEGIGVGMVALHVFLICKEHQHSIPALSFVYIAAMHENGLVSG